MKLFDGGLTALIIFAAFGYFAYQLDRSTDEQGNINKEAFKEEIKEDADDVVDEVTDAWKARKPLDYSKLND